MKIGISPQLWLLGCSFAIASIPPASASQVELNTSFADQGRLTLSQSDDTSASTQFVFREAVALNGGGFLLAFDEERPQQVYRSVDAFFNRTRNFSAVKLVKINAAGDIDTEYGDNGVLSIPLEYSDRVLDVSKLSDGKLMVTVEGIVNDCSVVLSATRLNADGTLDTEFGAQGRVSKLYGGNEGNVCYGYDYNAWFVTEEVAVTENDELLAVISGPGSFNSAYAGEIPVMISPSGEFSSKSATTCGQMTSVGGSHAAVCADYASIDSDNSVFVYQRLDLSATEQETIRTVLDFNTLLDVPFADAGLDFAFFDMMGNAAGELVSLMDVTQIAYQDNQWQPVYKQKILIKLNAENQIDSQAFDNGLVTGSTLPVLENSQKIQLLTNNDLLLMGEGFIAKINQSGEPDTDYGNDGAFQFASEGFDHQDWFYDELSNHAFILQANDSELKITNLNGNGATHSEFADNGVLTFSIDTLNNRYASGFSPSVANQIALFESGELRIDLENQDRQLVSKVSTTGVIDSDFGINGRSTSDVSEQGERLQVKTLDDGSWLVLTTEGLYKYASSGELDTSFGISGAYLTDIGYQHILIQDNGHIILAGDDALSVHILHLSPQGRFNDTWLDMGKREIKLGSDELGIFADISQTPNADARTAYKLSPLSAKHLYGTVVSGNKFDLHFRVSEQQRDASFDINQSWHCLYTLRFEHFGDLDVSFADSGIHRHCNAQPFETYLNDLEATPVAQFVLDQQTVMLLSNDWYDVDTARIMTRGLTIQIQDASGAVVNSTSHLFSDLTTLDFRNIFAKDLLNATLQPDGKMVVAVQYGENLKQLALLRFNRDGSLDNQFADNGAFSNNQQRTYLDYRDFTMVSDQMYLSGELHGNAVVVNLQEQNLFPVISADAVTAIALDEDSASQEYSIAALDDNGDALEWHISSEPSLGALSISQDSGQVSFVYTPEENVNGNDSFELSVRDWRGGEQTHFVNVNVVPVNDVPMVSLPEDRNDLLVSGNPVTIVAQASDIDGDELTYSWEQIQGPTIVQPEQNRDSFSFRVPTVSVGQQIMIQVTVSDGTLTASDTINIAIWPESAQDDVVGDSNSSGGAMSPGVLAFLMLLVSLVRRKSPGTN